MQVVKWKKKDFEIEIVNKKRVQLNFCDRFMFIFSYVFFFIKSKII